MKSFDKLIGTTIASISIDSDGDRVILTTDDGETYVVTFEGECCERSIFICPTKSIDINSKLANVETDERDTHYRIYTKFNNITSGAHYPYEDYDSDIDGTNENDVCAICNNIISCPDEEERLYILQLLQQMHESWIDIADTHNNDNIEVRTIRMLFDSAGAFTFYLITASNGYYSPDLRISKMSN